MLVKTFLPCQAASQRFGIESSLHQTLSILHLLALHFVQIGLRFRQTIPQCNRIGVVLAVRRSKNLKICLGLVTLCDDLSNLIVGNVRGGDGLAQLRL